MWHLSLHHRQQVRRVRLRIPATASAQTPPHERHYVLRSLPLPLTSLELDIWRPLRPDERERLRNRPMDGEIRPLPQERPQGMPEDLWQRLRRQRQAPEA